MLVDKTKRVLPQVGGSIRMWQNSRWYASIVSSRTHVDQNLYLIKKSDTAAHLR